MTRLISKLRGQTTLAQKVFDCVPIESTWTLHEINNEMMRQGRHIERNVLEACVSQLVDARLVKQHGSKPYTYNREPVITGKPKKETPVKKELEPVRQPIDPLSRIENLAHRLREIASEFDTVALEIAEMRDKEKSQLDTLHQLQSLLKGLGA